MTDTATTLTPASAMTTGAQTVTASAALFAVTDIGRGLSVLGTAPARTPATAYTAGQVFVASYAGIDRLYRVTAAGTTAAYATSGTTPDYDLNAPRQVGTTIADGSAILRYLGQGKLAWGFGQITAFTDATHVTVTVDPRGPFVAAAASPRWKLGEFSDARGWPRCMSFHQNRSWWGGTTTKPQTIWASQAGDYQNMTPTEPDNTVLDTDAITVSLDDDTVNTIKWLASHARGLAVGAASGEFMLSPASATGGALSPSNIRGARQSDRGSNINARARVSGIILFVQRGGRRLRQLEYDFSTDSFTTLDLTELADHITGAGIVEVAYQTIPDGILWAVRSDGVLISLTFDREQKVRAWSKHILGGSAARVESVCVVPSPDGTTEDVYVSVARTFNGVTSRTIEYIRAPYRAELDGATGAYFVDCGLSYTGTPATDFAGLTHLEGQAVQLVGDGSVRQGQTVVTGAVHATGPASAVMHIGLPYQTQIITLPPEAGAGAGSAQNQLKRVSEVSIRFVESLGGECGREDAMEPILARTLAMPMGTAIPPYTGDRRIKFPAGWDRAGQVTIQSSDPLPLTVLAIITDLQTNG